MNKIFTIFLIFGALTACKRDDKNTLLLENIPIDVSVAVKANIGDVCDSMIIIKLPKEPILGNITGIQMTKNYLFLFDKGRFKIFVYDHQGNYINTLDKRGRAPGEYLYIKSFSYHEDSQELIINDPVNQSVFYYSLPDLTYIGKQTFPVSPEIYMRIDSIHCFCIYASMEEPKENGCFILDGTLKKQLPINNNYISMVISSCSVYKDLLYYTYSDDRSIIYGIERNQCIPLFEISYGENKIKDTRLFQKITPDIMSRLKFDFEKKLYAGVAVNTIVSPDKVMFNYVYGEIEQSKVYTAVYDRNKKIVKNYSSITISGISSPLFPLTTYDDFFVSLIIPENSDYDENKVDDQLGKTILDELNTTDFTKELCHPLLVMYKLK